MVDVGDVDRPRPAAIRPAKPRPTGMRTPRSTSSSRPLAARATSSWPSSSRSRIAAVSTPRMSFDADQQLVEQRLEGQLGERRIGQPVDVLELARGPPCSAARRRSRGRPGPRRASRQMTGDPDWSEGHSMAAGGPVGNGERAVKGVDRRRRCSTLRVWSASSCTSTSCRASTTARPTSRPRSSSLAQRSATGPGWSRAPRMRPSWTWTRSPSGCASCASRWRAPTSTSRCAPAPSSRGTTCPSSTPRSSRRSPRDRPAAAGCCSRRRCRAPARSPTCATARRSCAIAATACSSAIPSARPR